MYETACIAVIVRGPHSRPTGLCLESLGVEGHCIGLCVGLESSLYTVFLPPLQTAYETACIAVIVRGPHSRPSGLCLGRSLGVILVFVLRVYYVAATVD